MKKAWVVLSIVLLLPTAHAVGRLPNGDPARWYKEDRTAAEHILRYRKEAVAAFAENKMQCKGNKSCLIEAHEIYIADMKDIIHRLWREIDDYYPR